MESGEQGQDQSFIAPTKSPAPLNRVFAWGCRANSSFWVLGFDRADDRNWRDTKGSGWRDSFNRRDGLKQIGKIRQSAATLI
jgi:hypothetical protein